MGPYGIRQLLRRRVIEGARVSPQIPQMRTNVVLDDLGHKTGHCTPRTSDPTQDLLDTRLTIEGKRNAFPMASRATNAYSRLLSITKCVAPMHPQLGNHPLRLTRHDALAVGRLRSRHFAHRAWRRLIRRSALSAVICPGQLPPRGRRRRPGLAASIDALMNVALGATPGAQSGLAPESWHYRCRHVHSLGIGAAESHRRRPQPTLLIAWISWPSAACASPYSIRVLSR